MDSLSRVPRRGCGGSSSAPPLPPAGLTASCCRLRVQQDQLGRLRRAVPGCAGHPVTKQTSAGFRALPVQARCRPHAARWGAPPCPAPVHFPAPAQRRLTGNPASLCRAALESGGQCLPAGPAPTAGSRRVPARPLQPDSAVPLSLSRKGDQPGPVLRTCPVPILQIERPGLLSSWEVGQGGPGISGSPCAPALSGCCRGPPEPLHGNTTHWPWWGRDCPFIVNSQSGSPWWLG